MKSDATIVRGCFPHNRLPVGVLRACLTIMALATTSIAALAVGCAAPGPTSPEIPAWELANAKPVKPIFLGRVRLS